MLSALERLHEGEGTMDKQTDWNNQNLQQQQQQDKELNRINNKNAM